MKKVNNSGDKEEERKTRYEERQRINQETLQNAITQQQEERTTTRYEQIQATQQEIQQNEIRQQQQTTTDKQETEDEEMEWLQEHGDKRNNGKHLQNDRTVRIATWNINTFPKLGSIKSRRIKQEIQGIDCLGLSEINKNWYKVHSQESFRRRVEDWWHRHKTQQSWLRDRTWPSEFQQGGVSLTTVDELSDYCREKGEDSSGLGRWSWQLLEGHSQTKTAIIQIYRPVHNRQDRGSTYMQQWAEAEAPYSLQIFDEDLLKMVDGFIEDLCQVIIMGDFNIPLNGTSTLQKELKERGIEDVISNRYQARDTPGTHRRGQHPIDGIFASESIMMVQGGYERGMSEITDHRMVWADITWDSLLGRDRGEIKRPKGRRLQLTSKKRTKKFNTIFRKLIRTHRLIHKARKLEKEIGDNKYMTIPQQQQYETIYDQRERATKHAEQGCTKLAATDDPFSPQLQEAMGMSIIRSEIARKIKNNRKVHKRWLMNMKSRWGIDTTIEIPRSIEQANADATTARQKYRQLQQSSPELRSQFLDVLIQEAASTGNEKKLKDLRAIREHEQTRDVHTRIKLARGMIRGGGVSFVHKVDEDGNTETVKDKLQMEREILHANETKLYAANESPLRQGELSDILTDHDYDRWELFLSGEIELPNDLEEGTKRWLEKFAGTDIQEDDSSFTTEEYVAGWNRVKEHTSCVPGALHFGTFKAMRGCSEAAELHTIMARIPMKTGYTPKQWTRSVDSMLPKKKDVWLPEKLRLTSLLRPDFNHNNKILGRKAMALAESKGQLAPEQYGSRKRLSAEKHALNKRLMIDVLRLQRRPGVICANDAKACYDRILHFAAYISLRKTGLTKPAVISMLEPIRRLTHKIRTAYGDSEIEYGGDNWKRDPSGICQGNGAGPAIWALVSSPLLSMLRDAGFGAKLHSAIGDTFLHLSGFAFVDDADTIQAGELGEDTPSILQKAQQQLNLWESGIRSTGGGIDGDKSDFVIINYEWNEGEWRYQKKQDEHKLTVHNTKGPREQLTQLATNEARRTLGVWQAADGNEEKQTTKLVEKTKAWSRAVVRSSLGRLDMSIGIKASLYPSITFGMMATTLSVEQCDRVFAPIRAEALSKSGYVKTIPKVITHAHEAYGGIGMTDLYTYQGIQHLKALIGEGGSTTATGKLLHILLHGHVLEIGTRHKLLEQKYEDVKGLLTTSWLKHTLEFITKNKIQIQHTQDHLQLWREGDSCIMDDIFSHRGTNISTDDITRANRCRMYLKAVTKSDISNGRGTAILESARLVYKDWESISEQAYKWPHQPRPGRKDREAWQRVLYAVYSVDRFCRLYTVQIGNWTKGSRKHTRWLYDPASLSLYKREGKTWTRWAPLIRRSRSTHFSETSDTAHTAQARWRIAQVTTTQSGDTAQLEGIGEHAHTQAQRQQTIPGQQQRNILTHRIVNMHKAVRWVLEDTETPDDDGKAIAATIIQGNAKCISDGSTKERLGTSAAIMVMEDETKAYLIKNRVPGVDDEQHSYRSELCGILANVLMINIIAKIHDIQDGRITIGCDNESALWKCFLTDTTDTGDSSFDLIRVIHEAIKVSTITWTPVHVRGHQDRDNAIDTLDEWARANVHADKQAEIYWKEKYGDGNRDRPRPGIMPGEGWRVSIDGEPLHDKMADQLHQHIYKKPCMDYWTKKGRIKKDMGHEVDWNEYKKAQRTMKYGKRQWVKKHFCGHEGTNQMMFKWKQRPSPQCPKCAQIETHRHIARCQSRAATQAYQDATEKFKQWLDGTTSPGIKAAVLAHVKAYRDEAEVDVAGNWSHELMDTSETQSRIGPNAFFEGCISHKWERIQKVHLNAMKSKRSPARWARELIKKLWLISWDMWANRNGWIHNEATGRAEQITKQLDTDMARIYEDGRSNRFLPLLERAIFRQPIDEIKKQTDYQKRVWIHMAEKIIERDEQRVARCRSVQIMRGFFQPNQDGQST